MLRVLAVVVFLNIGYFIRNVISDNKNFKIDIPKCCAENEAIVIDPVYYNVSCQSLNTSEPPPSASPNIIVYDKNVHDKPTKKSFFDIFQVAVDKKPDEDEFKSNYIEVGSFLHYLSENGDLYLEYPNAYYRWLAVNNSYYCVDYKLEISKNATEPPRRSDNLFFCCGYAGEPPKPTSSFFTAALLISVFFLILVFVVYMLLPGLRNLGGMVLMAYVFSLLSAFVFLSIIQLFQHGPKTCIGLTTVVYFFFLASFCWMTVMSYDIWWTFRGYAKARPIHRRGENFKFAMYCIYGWGVPLAMSIAFVVLNSLDMSHMPWFVTPQVPGMGCFIEEGQKLVYLYAPMLILILCNWMFFLMTAFNIWRLNRDTAVLDSPAAGTPQAHRNQRTRFFIYLKLSIVMGINWILEVVSSLTPDFSFWYISDAYNLLIGLAIFLIFVCKKKIYRDLKARFIKKQIPQRSLTKSQTSCTTLSTSSQDTPLQVFQDPNGTGAKR